MGKLNFVLEDLTQTISKYDFVSQGPAAAGIPSCSQAPRAGSPPYASPFVEHREMTKLNRGITWQRLVLLV